MTCVSSNPLPNQFTVATFARMMAPAALSFVTIAASRSGIGAPKGLNPAVVGMPATSMRSFTTIGMPCSAERRPFDLRSASSARASAMAFLFSVMTALSLGPFLSYASILLEVQTDELLGVSAFASIAALMSAIVAVESSKLAAFAATASREQQRGDERSGKGHGVPPWAVSANVAAPSLALAAGEQREFLFERPRC